MLERSEELCPLAGQASLWREAAAEQALHGNTVSLFAWRAIRKLDSITRARQRAGIRARAERRALPPCGASLLMARRKGNSAKRCFCRSGRSRHNFTKTKVLKRKRQKIHISKHRIPICVARHKETRQYHSRTTACRDSCSSEATYPIKRGAAGCSKTAQRNDDVRDGSTRARRLCSRGDCQRCRDSALGQDGANTGLILR